MTAFLSNPVVPLLWLLPMLASLWLLLRDLRLYNSHLMPLMQVVWTLTVVYSGPLGLALYWWSGRKEIATDSTPRRAARSVAHCYSGFGMGEILGLVLSVGVQARGATGTAALTFAMAYTFGFALSVGPMVQAGVGWREAAIDAAVAETPSIVVMEAGAIGVDLALAGSAGLGTPLFWSSMVLSLSCGLLAAWPVNWLLIRQGIKEGMMDPRDTGHRHD